MVRPCPRARGVERRHRRLLRRCGRIWGLLVVRPAAVRMRRKPAARTCLSSDSTWLANRFQGRARPPAVYSLPPPVVSSSLSSLPYSLPRRRARRCAYSTPFHSCTSRTRSSLRRYSSTLVGRAGSYISSQSVSRCSSVCRLLLRFLAALRPPRCRFSAAAARYSSSAPAAAQSARVLRWGAVGGVEVPVGAWAGASTEDAADAAVSLLLTCAGMGLGKVVGLLGFF